MTDKQRTDRLVKPGEQPTDADLRHDVELTRQELAETVGALGAKADVRGRIQRAGRKKVDAIRDHGDELVDRFPDPVATRVRPVVDTATRRPARTLAGLLTLVLVLMIWRKRRHI